MKLHFPRKKPRQPLLSFFYRLSKVPFAPPKARLRLWLKLHWIFWRIASEDGFRLYGFEDGSMRRMNLDFLLNKLSKGHTVMDLGCNNGAIAELLAEKAKKVVGVDHDASAIESARATKAKANLEFHQADALEYLKANDTRFDVLVLSHILEHLDEPTRFLTQFKDHFQHLYIEVPDLEDNYLNLYRIKVGSNLNYTDDDHIWEWDRASFLELLQEAGLKVQDAEYRFGLQKYWCATG